MELKYKEGDAVLVKARIIKADPSGHYWAYQVTTGGSSETMWVGDNDIYTPTPEPTPAASPTRPDGEPPMFYRDTPYQVGRMDWLHAYALSQLNFWGIDWKLISVKENGDLLIQVTAVSQAYLDAVAEKQAADTTTD